MTDGICPLGHNEVIALCPCCHCTYSLQVLPVTAGYVDKSKARRFCPAFLLPLYTPVLCWVYKSSSESKITYSKCCANMANKVIIVINSTVAEGGGCSLIWTPGWRYSELGGSSNTSLTLPTLPLHLCIVPFPLYWNLVPVPTRKGTGTYVLRGDGNWEPFILQKRDTLEKGFDTILCEEYKQTGLSAAWYPLTLSF